MSRATYAVLCLLVFAIPLENMLVLPGVGTISRLIGLLAVMLGGLALFIDRRGRMPGPALTLFALYLLWSMASFFWSIELEISKRALISLTQLFVLSWLIWEYAPSEQALLGLLQAYVLGAGGSALATFYNYLQGGGDYYLRYTAAGFDPNDLGLTLALGVPLAWYLVLQAKNRWLICLNALYLPLAVLAIALTASRSAFISLLLPMIFVLWSTGRLGWWGRTLVFGLLGVGAVILINLVPASSWQRLATIGQEVISGSMNSRRVIWEAGFQVFAEAPLCGIGVGAFRYAVEEHLGTIAAPHNLYLSILAGQGLIGLLLFSALPIWGFLSSFRLPVLDRNLWLIMLATWGLGVMTLGWELRKPTWLLFALLAGTVAHHQGEVLQRRPEARMVLS